MYYNNKVDQYLGVKVATNFTVFVNRYLSAVWVPNDDKHDIYQIVPSSLT